MIVTFGSSTGPVREAAEEATAWGLKVKVVSLRLLMPAQTTKFEEAIAGADRLLVVEQTHSRQFYRYLRAYYDLPRDVRVLNRPGPLPIRPGEVLSMLKEWS